MNVINSVFNCSSPRVSRIAPVNNYVTPSVLLNNDCFTKSINFTGGSTSNGAFLKPLEGIRDPYSDVVIITNKEMSHIAKQLQKQRTIRQKIQVLEHYKDSLLPVEKKVFEIFKMEAAKDKSTTFSEILKSKEHIAHRGLIKEENAIFNQIEKKAYSLNSDFQDKIFNCIEEARYKVELPETDDNKFKRKTFISKLVAIQENGILDRIEEKVAKTPTLNQDQIIDECRRTRYLLNNKSYDVNHGGRTSVERVKDLQRKYLPETLKEPQPLEEIINLAEQLPTSKDSVNAFIVKYSNRSDKEIGERLINQSAATIEHIKADSKGGENEAYNFMLATRSRNEERGNMPISEFMEKYPNIPTYCQHYVDDIIVAAEKNQIPDHKWYPYVLKDTLKKEANIDIDISNYKITPQKAFKTFPKALLRKFPQYKIYLDDTQKNKELNYIV